MSDGPIDPRSPGVPAADGASALARSGLELWLWRHPRPRGVRGRCIGRTDVRVDPRRAKRLAHRIRATQRRQGGPAEIWTSPLRRCAEVAAWLGRWGWTVRVDAALLELDFGDWDGRDWSAVPWSAVAAWEADFAAHAPGGGESLQAMATRLAAWLATGLEDGSGGGPERGRRIGRHDGRTAAWPVAGLSSSSVPAVPVRRWVVAHAGAMRLLQRLSDGLPGAVAQAADWPAPPPHARLMRLQVGTTAGLAQTRSPDA